MWGSALMIVPTLEEKATSVRFDIVCHYLTLSDNN